MHTINSALISLVLKKGVIILYYKSMSFKRSSSIIVLIICILVFTSCGSKSPATPKAPITLGEKTVKNGVYLQDEDISGIKQSELLEKIRSFAYTIDSEARNAKFDDKRWSVLENESIGKKVNVEGTFNAVMNAAEGSRVNLQIGEITPTVTAQQLISNIEEIGSFSTKILDKQDSRINNIEIAARKLDLKKIAPGEEFSFNGTLGRRTEEKGYEEAPIIIKTEEGFKKGLGVGGGICQLSTTIYNAVEKCNMEITERHIHSKNVGYVPRGKDATVAYGAVDFKFRNTRNFPVMLRVYLSDSYLTVKIFENRN